MERSTKENAVRQTRRRSIYNNEASRQRPIISFEDVTKKYQNGVEALRNLSFRIEEGEFVFLMGSSGAGKSTLIKLILLEERPTSGRIYVKSRNVARLSAPRFRHTGGASAYFSRISVCLKRKPFFRMLHLQWRLRGHPGKRLRKR